MVSGHPQAARAVISFSFCFWSCFDFESLHYLHCMSFNVASQELLLL